MSDEIVMKDFTYQRNVLNLINMTYTYILNESPTSLYLQTIYMYVFCYLYNLNNLF